MSTIRAPIAVASCNTIAQEVRECCQQLGLPARLYSNRPACLFEDAPGVLEEILDGATGRHGQLLLAFGQCCGDIGRLAREHNAAAVSVARCTELLTGTGTYEWCAQHEVLLLPPGYFSIWLRRLERDRALAATVKSRVQAPDVRRIAGVDEGGRSIDPDAIAEMEHLSERRTTPLYTGLGHVREALRAAAHEAGLPVLSEQPCPIDPHTLGPGDNCLLVAGNADTGISKALRLVSDGIQRGLKSVWVGQELPGAELIGGGERQTAQLRQWQETGELQVLSREALLEDAAAATSPRQLVEYWIARSLDALQEGLAGIAIVHGCDWAEAPGLSTEYLLEYSARLSAACSQWPILAGWQVSAETWAPNALDELGRTHPLSWANAQVVASREFVPSDDYLGGQMTLESLAAGAGSPECPALAALVSALADGELDGGSSAAITSHVDGCPTCSRDVRDWQEITQVLRSLGAQRTPVPEDFWSRVRGAMERKGQ